MGERLRLGAEAGRDEWRRKLPYLRTDFKVIAILAPLTFLAILAAEGLGLI